jgi:superfamily I DNA/RNA helicase
LTIYNSPPHSWLLKNNRKNYNPENDKVTMVTQHSSKGLEFPRVIVAGIGQLKDAETDVPEQMRLLYVAMTRAQEALLLTASNENCYVRRFLEVG